VAKLVYGMNQSLDGCVDHLKFRPSRALFPHFMEQVRVVTGSVHGRRMYERMRYWDDDRPDWGVEEQDFAAAWRSKPKWVVSRTLKKGSGVLPTPFLVMGSAHRSTTHYRSSD
jgi:hypothetical protein